MRARSRFLALALALACRGTPAPSAPAPVARGIPAASPAALGFDSARLARVGAYLQTAVDSGAFPGAVLAVGRHGRLALLAPVGHYATTDRRPVQAGTIYDLASLTKVIGLTTVSMLLVDAGTLALDAPVQRYLPEFRGPLKERVTIRHLLTHSAGLVADLPLYDSTKTRTAALAAVDTTTLFALPGTEYRYSDLSAIVLMQVVERVTGEPLERFLDERVFRPLGMPATRFLPPAAWRDRIAPTENDTTFRHRLLWGEVHDESAARLGGVSGNAGLFSDAPDLARFAALLLNGGAWDTLQLIRAETIAEFTRRQAIPPGSTRALGWDTPPEQADSTASAGTRLSPRAFGHTGYTGTSIWLDPERDLFIILLTNRVNPTRANMAIRRVRPRVADSVVAALIRPEL